MYQVLAQDIVYADPMKLVTSLDNHDMDRFLSVVGEDFSKYKMGVTLLLTTRGIPSWYYGTEILMKNFKNPTDAEVRQNFPGGFADDQNNKFTANGRTEKENEAFNYVRTLASYRKNNAVLHSGKLMQYVPQEGVYVYFRYSNEKSVMVVTNTNDNEQILSTERFSERIAGFSRGINVITNQLSNDLSFVRLPARSSQVIELIR